MTTERRPRSPTSGPGPAPTHDLKRIPLPPLPHFRRPDVAPQASTAARPMPVVTAADAATRATSGTREAVGSAIRPAGSVSHLEMSELLGPDHEGGIAPAIEPAAPQRTGATGATILNDLVDQIEKGLEKELARTPIEVLTQGYRSVVACAGGMSGRAAGSRPSRQAPSPPGDPERRTGE